MHTIKESKIFQNKNITISHSVDVELIIVNWNHNRPLSMDVFKKEMLHFKNEFMKHRPKSVIWLQEEFASEITPETHLWVEENINKVCLESGLKKVAFVVGEDVMAHLSVFNFFEEVESVIRPKHFAGLQEAIDWILNRDDIPPNDIDKIDIKYLGKTKNGKSQYTIETAAQNTESTLKSFTQILKEHSFLKENAEKFYSLTQREREVFRMYASGKGFKDIATKLFLSEFTVRTHWRNAKKKLGIKSLSDISNYKNSFL